LRKLVDGVLRESGAYVRHESKAGGICWHKLGQMRSGMNQAIDVYGEGKNSSRYARWIRLPFDVKRAEYGQMVHTVAGMLVEQAQR